MLRSDFFALLFTLSFKCDCHQSHVRPVSGPEVTRMRRRRRDVRRSALCLDAARVSCV